MTRHKPRAGRRESGVTLMELLIAMVIAAVFFTAAVPFFVQAMSTSSRDRMRVVAVNAAQDRIEKIHQLDYSEVAQASLEDPTFYPVTVGSTTTGFFGPTWTVTTAAGKRTLNVGYSVITEPGSTTSAGYKVVTITVSWTGNPTMVKPVVLSTIVYPQYAGPQISSFTLADYNPITDVITSARVTLTATIAAADIQSMAPVNVGTKTVSGYVVFTITPPVGTASSVTVYYSSASPGTYTTTWTAPDSTVVSDGAYTFAAVAYSASANPGNTWQFTKRIQVLPPAPVTHLIAGGTQGVDGVSLTWTDSVSSDIAHYVVTRTLVTDTGTVTTTFTPSLDATATGYTDPGAPADSDCSYTVTAVDVSGKSTSATVDVVWTSKSTPPNPVQNLRVSQSSTSSNYVILSWDPPVAIPGLTVMGYKVYAGGDTTTPEATVSGTETSVTSLHLDWNHSEYYQVQAYSSYMSSGWGSIATTPAQQTVTVGVTPWVEVSVGQEPALYTLQVTNNVRNNTTFTLWYRGTDGGNATATQIAPIEGYTAQHVGDVVSWTGLHDGVTANSYELRWGADGVADGSITGSSQIVTVTIPPTGSW